MLIKPRLWAIFLLFILQTNVFANENLPPIESFFKHPNISHVTLSPKGNYVAYVGRSTGDKQALFVRSSVDLTDGQVVSTAAAGDTIYGVHWVNEDRLVIQYRSEQSEAKDFGIDLIAIDRTGAKPVHLISGSYYYHQDGAGTAIKNKTLDFYYRYFDNTRDGSDDIIVSKSSVSEAKHQLEGLRLFRLNTKTQKITDLLDVPQPQHIKGWLLDTNDMPRIGYAVSEGQCSTYYLAPNNKDWVELTHADCYDGESFSPFKFESETSLFVTKSYHGFEALYRYDLVNKKLAAEPFLTLNGMDFNGSISTDLQSKKTVGIRYESDAYATVWLDSKLKQIQANIDAVLTQTNNFIGCGLNCLTAPAVVVTARSDRQPNQYYVYNVATQKIIGLGGQHPDIKPAQMGMRDFVYYTARDGLKIPMYVTLPPHKSDKPYPTILYIHGGPNVRGASWEWERDIQFLASRGYVVLEPQYRGSTGFGHAFFKAGWKQWGSGMIDDMVDATQFAIQKGWTDAKHIGVMGASYGGYGTLMSLIRYPEIYQCGVEWAGVTDMDLMFHTPQSDQGTEALDFGLKVVMGDPEKDAAMFKQYSPQAQAANLHQPLLMAHGAEDRRVPIVHADDFYSAVKKHNPHIEKIIYANEGHGWQHDDNNIDFWTRVEKFLDKNLK